jgi:hypothetical protein
MRGQMREIGDLGGNIAKNEWPSGDIPGGRAEEILPAT